MKSQTYVFKRLNNKELYAMQNYYGNSKPTFQIYLLPRKVTVNTFTRMFQYKSINNVLYLNKMFFVFKKVTTSL